MIWLIGYRGMLGSELEKMLVSHAMEYVASDRDVDITDPAAVRAFAGARKITWIINCAAYTAVDTAEDEREQCYRINRDGVHTIALIAKEIGATLIHISTDYVFDGTSDLPLTEESETHPLSVYGASKLAGEQAVEALMENYFIIRTAWLYGAAGKNFVSTMLRLFHEREEVRVVNDQWGSPTYAKDLACAIIEIIKQKQGSYGIYHFTNEGRITWYMFAEEICKQAKERGLLQKSPRLIPITTAEYPTKAVRPAFSYLSKDKIKHTFSFTLADYRESLRQFMEEIEEK